jgi:cytoskeletal protein CcmA (bactofilin family)
MAIFNNSNSTSKSSATNTNTTIITQGTQIKGEINLSCKLYIDGHFDGDIISSQEVNVGKNGIVNGKIFAQKVIVQGQVDGNVSASVVELKADSILKGTIESQELIIEAKAIFEGNSVKKEYKDPTIKDEVEKKKSNKQTGKK